MVQIALPCAPKTATNWMAENCKSAWLLPGGGGQMLSQPLMIKGLEKERASMITLGGEALNPLLLGFLPEGARRAASIAQTVGLDSEWFHSYSSMGH